MSAWPHGFAPYDLAYITRDIAGHRVTTIGEIMSRRFEVPALEKNGTEGRYMVRRVPGDPLTLEEVHADDITGDVPSGPLWIHYARVRGPQRSAFPDDMLRFDRCVLASEPPDLYVAQVSDKPFGQWTPARWSSFQWSLEPLKSKQYHRGE